MFTVVNDDKYDYANLIDGMIIDEVNGFGTDITTYTTGSAIGGPSFDST